MPTHCSPYPPSARLRQRCAAASSLGSGQMPYRPKKKSVGGASSCWNLKPRALSRRVRNQSHRSSSPSPFIAEKMSKCLHLPYMARLCP
jgi:hypothetical protein